MRLSFILSITVAALLLPSMAQAGFEWVPDPQNPTVRTVNEIPQAKGDKKELSAQDLVDRIYEGNTDDMVHGAMLPIDAVAPEMQEKAGRNVTTETPVQAPTPNVEVEERSLDTKPMRQISFSESQGNRSAEELNKDVMSKMETNRSASVRQKPVEAKMMAPPTVQQPLQPQSQASLQMPPRPQADVQPQYQYRPQSQLRMPPRPQTDTQPALDVYKTQQPAQPMNPPVHATAPASVYAPNSGYMPTPYQEQPSQHYDVIHGFGDDVPLAMALQSILPEGVSYAFAGGVNPGTKVFWDGQGRIWPTVLEEMLLSQGMEARFKDDKVTVMPARLRLNFPPMMPHQGAGAMQMPPPAFIEPAAGNAQVPLEKVEIRADSSVAMEQGVQPVHMPMAHSAQNAVSRDDFSSMAVHEPNQAPLVIKTHNGDYFDKLLPMPEG